MQDLCYIFYHMLNVGHHFGFLRNNGGVNIVDDIHIFFQKCAHMRKQLHTGNPLIFRICVREMSSDIAKRCCPQKRIHNGMQKHIRVGMSQKAFLPGDIHSPQYQIPSLHQFVYIIPHTYTYHDRSPFLPWFYLFCGLPAGFIRGSPLSQSSFSAIRKV